MMIMPIIIATIMTTGDHRADDDADPDRADD